VYAFGGNQFGQLGIGQSAMSFSDMPMAVDELSGRTITSVGAGAYVSSALSGDGEIYTWGDGAHGKTARPDTRTTFVPWKIPTQGDMPSEPSLVTGAVNHRVVLDGDGFVTQLSMGAHHSIALYRTGTTECGICFAWILSDVVFWSCRRRQARPLAEDSHGPDRGLARDTRV
jgi:alpha-tubulin suppressor-like RCC1 family protein